MKKFMKIAIDEAKASLREGNKGFGAVLVKDGKIIALYLIIYNKNDPATSSKSRNFLIQNFSAPSGTLRCSFRSAPRHAALSAFGFGTKKYLS